MTENLAKFTPFGLTTIDAANALVLRSIAERDWEGMSDHLRILAYTPGDAELITLAEEHLKQTKNQMQIRKSAHSYTMADRLSSMSQETNFLKEANFTLYKELRLKMNQKGYLKWSQLGGVKEFESLEGNEKGEPTEQ